jgi:hypothetical protein
MLKYNTYILLLEAKDKRETIKKFADSPEIYDWAYDLNPKLSVWIAGSFCEELKKVRPDYLKVIQDKDKDSFPYLGLVKDIKYMQNTLNDKYKYVIDWIMSPVRNQNQQINFKGLTIDDAYKKSEQWHKSLDATGQIRDEAGTKIMVFPDGWYWIDLQTNYSKDEANAMGHCGNTHRDNTLLSLRHNKEPHVTAAYNSEGHFIAQMKGRNNKKPNTEYHPYIVSLLLNTDKKYRVDMFDLEYDNGGDFNISDLDTESLTKVLKAKPSLLLDSDNVDIIETALKRKIITEDELINKIKENKIPMKLYLKLACSDISLDLKKIDFEKDVSKHKEDMSECRMLVLYEKNVITKKQLCEYCDDLIWHNSGMCFFVNEWNDLSGIMDEYCISAIEGTLWEKWDSYYYRIEDVDYCWDLVDDKIKEDIRKASLGIELEYEDQTFTLTEENLVYAKPTSNKWRRNNEKDLCIITPEDGVIHRYEDVLNELKDDALEDMFDALSFAYSDCDNQARMDEVYKWVKEEVRDYLGDFEEIEYGKKSIYSKSDEKYKEVTRYIIVFDDPSNLLDTVYNNIDIKDLIDDTYYYQESLLYEFSQNCEKITLPDSDWYGDVTSEMFNEALSDKLWDKFSDKLKD